MSFPRYSAYRDSGVEWLGHVPSHWTLTKLGRLATSKCDGPFGSGLKSDHYLDEGARVVRLQNIRNGVFDGSDVAFIALDYFELELRGHDVVGGDLLIAGLGDERNTVGRACVAPHDLGPALVKADCFRFRLDRSEALPDFIAAQLTAGASADAGRLAGGSTRSRIPLSTMASRIVALPPLAEQRAINVFLDRECAKINALVAEQERLIGLLKEKRQAVISQAVTKGLDPTAPMRDSGIEWLGQVPAHWTEHRLSRRCGFASGKAHEPFIDIDGDFICVTARFVSTGGVEPRRCTQNLTPARRGDILMVMSDLPRGRALARAFLVKNDEPYAVNQRVCAITPRLDIPAFLAYQLDRSEWLLRNDDGVNQTHLSNDDFRKLPLLIPPRDEQELIAAFLDEVTATFDTLTTEAERAIALLKERRAALISAAVTGKIDVRGLAPAAALDTAA